MLHHHMNSNLNSNSNSKLSLTEMLNTSMQHLNNNNNNNNNNTEKAAASISASEQLLFDLTYNRPVAPFNFYEEEMMQSSEPLPTRETDEIEVNGERGVWLNKAEVTAWSRQPNLPWSLGDYPINEDKNPEIIKKVSSQRVEYTQDVVLRLLRPPTPASPGEIIIRQEANVQTQPAPPLVIRQQPARPLTPPPMIIREQPPQPPEPVGRKLITISGKRLPPPPRKLIIERLPQLPHKPQSVVVERWLAYPPQKRKVIFQRASDADPVVVAPKNVIVQWETPNVICKKEFKYLGVAKVNPHEYAAKYSGELLSDAQMPAFVHEIKPPQGIQLAAATGNQEQHQPDHMQQQQQQQQQQRIRKIYELEGDVHALSLVDLDKEGLTEYRSYVERIKHHIHNSSLPFPPLTVNTSSQQIQNVYEQAANYTSADFSFDSNFVMNSAAPLQIAQQPGSSPAGIIKPIARSPLANRLSPSYNSTNTNTNNLENNNNTTAAYDYNYYNPVTDSATVGEDSSVFRILPPTFSQIKQSAHHPQHHLQHHPHQDGLQGGDVTSSLSALPDAAPLAGLASPLSSSRDLLNTSTSGLTVGSVLASSTTAATATTTAAANEESLDELIYQIFRAIDVHNTGRIAQTDAERTLRRLNSRLIKKYSDAELALILANLNANTDGYISFGSFRKAFIQLSE